MTTNSAVRRAMEMGEGNGVRVRRLFPSPELPAYDPFALLDEFFIPEDAGFPEHEHRGFEAYTYVREGALVHSDTSGGKGTIDSGGLQHFVAGRGLAHSEMPVKGRGLCHGFQVWVNLPRTLKNESPSYRMWAPDQLPSAVEQGCTARHIVGNGSPSSSTIPLIFQDIHLDPHAHHFVSISPEMEGFLYCYSGEIEASDVQIREGECFLLPHAAETVLYAGRESRLILLAGVPLKEPIRIVGAAVE